MRFPTYAAAAVATCLPGLVACAANDKAKANPGTCGRGSCALDGGSGAGAGGARAGSNGGTHAGGGIGGTSGTGGTSGDGGNRLGGTGGDRDGAVLDAPDGGDSVGPTALKMTDFLDSIGVCVHIEQGVDDDVKSATAMKFAGIRELRDDGNPGTVPHWITVFQQAGVRTNVLTNQDVSSTVDMAKQLKAAGALLSVEGPNEPNNFRVVYEGQTSDSNGSFVPVAHLQRDLYAAIKAEPTLKDVPVFHSSEAGGSEPDNVGLQFLTIPAGAGTTMPEGTKYADYANTHNYVCGHSSKLVDNVCWNATDPTLNGDWDGLYVEYGHTWHGAFSGYSNTDLQTLPKVSTETGWTTTGNGSITEEQQGRVFLNLYLAAFKRGWAYTFIYMLRDDPVQGYWGLFDTGYNAKKSGVYLHNLTTILADTGSTTPKKLSYSITNEPMTVHDLLLQKSNGTFDVVVWNERPQGGSNDVTVDLGRSRGTVKIYDPTTGTAPTKVLGNVSSVVVTTTDHPVVIEL